MGVYYKIACDELRENIDPGDINDLGIKIGAITSPDLCDHTGDMGPDWPGHDLPHGPSVRRANAFLGDMAWWVRY